ncbi:MAG: HEPN domain-containing protein [Alcaligenes aquatilis]
MGFGLKRADLQAMAEAKLVDANILYHNARYSSAYYLAGYAVEFALKSCISRQMAREVIPDKSFVTRIYTHQLTELVKLAGLESDLKRQASEFEVNWAITKDWSEQSRYEVMQQADAQYLLEAITNESHGVMQWIKRHW